MPQFINNSGEKLKEGRKTVFTHSLEIHTASLKGTALQPHLYDIVEFIGRTGTGDNVGVFRAKDEGARSWGFYIGTIGDEFN